MTHRPLFISLSLFIVASCTALFGFGQSAAAQSVDIDSATTYIGGLPVGPIANNAAARYKHELGPDPITVDFTGVGFPTPPPADPKEVSQFELFEGNVRVKTLSTGGNPNASFSISYVPTKPGNTTLFVSALLKDGTRVNSSGIQVQIVGGIITNPVAGDLLPYNSSIIIEGNIDFAGGFVRYVEFYVRRLSDNAEFLIGSDATFPYSRTWSPATTITDPVAWFGPLGLFEPATDVQLFLKGYDSKNNVLSSAPVPITILPNIDSGAVLKLNITQPVAGAVVAAGDAAGVQITAEARDAAGVLRLVSKVQFYVDGVAISTPDFTFPYTAVWLPTIPGTHVILAVAVDTKGNSFVSEEVSVNVTGNLPSISMTSPDAPNPGSPFAGKAGQPIQLSALVSASGGSLPRIQQVDFFSDGNLVGTASLPSTAPYEYSVPWVIANGVADGTVFTISARVTDLNGATATSSPVYVRVSGNNPPSISLVQPVAGLPVYAGVPVALLASASDSDGSVASVRFYVNGVLLTTDSAAPYEATLTPTSVGTYQIRAEATDDVGAVTSTATVVIGGTAAPTNKYTIEVKSQFVVEGVSTNFVIRRAGNTAASETIPLTYTGTALANLDYLQAPSTVTFPAGKTSVTLTIQTINNQVIDGIRTLTIYTPSATNSTLIITDDDNRRTPPPVVPITKKKIRI